MAEGAVHSPSSSIGEAEHGGVVAWSQLANLPGALTVGRLCIATIFPFTIHSPELTLGLYAVAIATDFLDGWVARALGQESAAGAILDGWADKVLHVNLLWTMSIAGYLPMWWLAPLLLREILLLPLIALLPGPIHRGASPLHKPILAGKVATVLTSIIIVALLMGRSELAPALAAGITLSGGFAGVHYLRRELRPGFRG